MFISAISMLHIRHANVVALFFSALLVAVLAVSIPKPSAALVSAYDARISATDNQGNKYEAWYLQDQYSSTGWSFYARKTTSTGFITQQQWDVSTPCDSYTYQMRLRISYDAPTGSWIVSFTDTGDRVFSKSFPSGGTFIQSGTYGHNNGSNVIVVSDTHTSTSHNMWLYHSNPICPAGPQ